MPRWLQSQAFKLNGSFSMEVYTLAGSSQGKETTPAAWTKIGGPTPVTATAFTGANYVPLPFNIGITLPPGGRQSFLITYACPSSCGDPSTWAVAYQRGINQYGQQYATNGVLGLVGGAGFRYYFANAFGTGGSGRLWVGVLHSSTV